MGWDVSNDFKTALTKKVLRYHVKAEVLDTNMDPVEGGTFFDMQSHSKDEQDEFQQLIIDGNIDVDTSRAVRRVFTLNILNREGAFSPHSDWSGLFYIDRIIRLYVGLVIANGTTEWVPVGTFMIDRVDTIVERNMSMVVMSGSDLWKKMLKAEFTHNRRWLKGKNVPDIIESVASSAGIRQFDIDAFDDRDNEEIELNKKRTAELGDNKGDFIWKLADDFGMEVYMDVMGRLTIAELANPFSQPVQWAFAPAQNSLLLDAKVGYKDDKLFNHIVVVGTGNKKQIVVLSLKDNDPTSPTRIGAIGNRIFRRETDHVNNVKQARRVARRLFRKHFRLSEDIQLTTINVPYLEGNDTIHIEIPEWTDVDGYYLVRSFSIPLASTRQTIRTFKSFDTDGGVGEENWYVGDVS